MITKGINPGKLINNSDLAIEEPYNYLILRLNFKVDIQVVLTRCYSMDKKDPLLILYYILK